MHDLGAERCGIVTFVVPGVGPDLVKARLAERRINVTVTGAAGTRLDMEARRLADLVRASVHRCNTAGEVERFGQETESLRRSAG